MMLSVLTMIKLFCSEVFYKMGYVLYIKELYEGSASLSLLFLFQIFWNICPILSAENVVGLMMTKNKIKMNSSNIIFIMIISVRQSTSRDAK